LSSRSRTRRHEFSQPVFWSRTRFQPPDGKPLRLISKSIRPRSGSHLSRLGGNVVTHAWFDGLHDSLTITARSIVAMMRENPFDYLPDSSRTLLPAYYGDEAETLRPYLRRESARTECTDEVAVFAARMRAAPRELLPFVATVNQTMSNAHAHPLRGRPGVAAHAYRRKVCAPRPRDVVDVRRAASAAARFVSGYEDSVLGRETYDLHAWAEVYIPGGGWRGMTAAWLGRRSAPRRRRSGRDARARPRSPARIDRTAARRRSRRRCELTAACQ
jgi:hypothetical protein